MSCGSCASSSRWCSPRASLTRIAKTTSSKRRRASIETTSLQLKEPRSAIAAAGRIGQHSLLFAEQFLTSKVPKHVQASREITDAYCDAIVENTDALFAHSIDAFSTCAAKANELGVHDDFAKLCMRELVKLEPEHFPPLIELVAKPSLVGRVEIALEGKAEQ